LGVEGLSCRLPTLTGKLEGKTKKEEKVKVKLNTNVEGEIIDYLTSPRYCKRLKKELKDGLRKMVFFKYQPETITELIVGSVMNVLKQRNFIVAKKIP